MRYEVGDRWSAASEGVLAALRLSKSAQSADKVHFSDSAELSFWKFQKTVALYQLLAVTIDHYCALPIKSARFLSQFGGKLDQKSYLLAEKSLIGSLQSLITLPASAASPMIEDFARDHGQSLRRRENGSAAGSRSALSAGELGGLSQGFDEAALVGDAFARDVERRPMIHRRSHHRQADGDVHARFEAEHLDGTVALVVIHGDDDVVVAACREEEQRVRRQWTCARSSLGRAMPPPPASIFVGFFAAAEQPVFAGVRIDAANADARIA